jgi:hypothetical protein
MRREAGMEAVTEAGLAAATAEGKEAIPEAAGWA